MIPITFNKDDNSNLKKGNIRGQDLASILSFGITKISGILDIWQNPVSVTSNVTSTGYSILTMNKGYVCIYGRLIYVEQGEQVQVALPSGSSTINGTLGIRINLGNTGASEVEWFAKTGDLRQDNILDDEVQGVFEFGIYSYTANQSGLTLGTKIAPILYDIRKELSDATTNATNYTNTKVGEAQSSLQSQINARTFLGEETTLYNGGAGNNFSLNDNIQNYKFIYIKVKYVQTGWVSCFELSSEIMREIRTYGDFIRDIPMSRGNYSHSAWAKFFNNGASISLGGTMDYCWVIGVK